MAKRHRWESRSRDATNHPIAWFSTLLRGIARNDKTMVEQPRRQLEELGYCVVRRPLDDEGRKGVV